MAAKPLINGKNSKKISLNFEKIVSSTFLTTNGFETSTDRKVLKNHFFVRFQSHLVIFLGKTVTCS
jgi:hypothetical protein